MSSDDFPPDFEDRLSNCLNKNYPAPPPASPFEYAQILHAIQVHRRRRRLGYFLSARWLLPLATAALLIGFFTLRGWNPETPMRVSHDFITASDSTWVYDEGSSELRSPSEDWLMLAEEVGTRK